VLPVGWEAVVVELGSTAEVRAAYRRLVGLREAGELPGVVELVPGARTVLVEGTAPDLAELLTGLAAEPAAEAASTVEIPVAYDGPDLAEVAALAGLAEDEVVRRHAAADYTVAFCGFAPGFGYLTGLPAELHVPRRATPRTAVPAGSVGIAGEYAGVYPRRSPGGWRLLGRTGALLWDADRDPPALLAPGTRVRFTPA
jgi:KipI family sensor histidine kinase inhibitor